MLCPSLGRQSVASRRMGTHGLVAPCGLVSQAMRPSPESRGLDAWPGPSLGVNKHGARDPLGQRHLRSAGLVREGLILKAIVCRAHPIHAKLSCSMSSTKLTLSRTIVGARTVQQRVKPLGVAPYSRASCRLGWSAAAPPKRSSFAGPKAASTTAKAEPPAGGRGKKTPTGL